MNGIEITEIRDYFRKLASEHKAIRHDSRNKGYFGYDLDEFNESSNRTKLSEFPLILAEIRPRYIRNSGNLRSQMMISFIVVALPSGNERDYESQYKAFDDAYKVGVEVWARIVADSRSRECPKSFDHLSGDECTSMMVGPYSTRHVGWRFSFTVKSVANVEVNPDVWQS